MPPIADVAGLLGTPEAWTDEDQAGMMEGFRQFTVKARALAYNAHGASGKAPATRCSKIAPVRSSPTKWHTMPPN